MNREDRIAKKIVALNSGEVQGLFNKYEEPELLYDTVKEFNDLGKIVQRDTTYQNDKDWWKIFKLDFDADTFQDELIDYIAHKYFLRVLKQVSNINKLKEGVDKFNSDNQNTDPSDLTRKQIEEKIEQARQFQNILNKCEKQSKQIGSYIQKMIESCSNLIGGDIAKFGRDKSQKKMYQGLIKNKAILKALNELKASLAEVKTKLEDKNGDYQFSDILSVTPAASSRVVKKASKSGDTFNAILQKYNDALKNKTYKKEEAAPAGGNSGGNAGGKPAAGGGNSSDQLDIKTGTNYGKGLMEKLGEIDEEFNVLQDELKNCEDSYFNKFTNSSDKPFANKEKLAEAIKLNDLKTAIKVTELAKDINDGKYKMFNSHIKSAVEKYSKNFSAYMATIYKAKEANSGPLYDFFMKVSKILKDVQQMFIDNVKRGGDNPAFRITRIARRIADSYLK